MNSYVSVCFGFLMAFILGIINFICGYYYHIGTFADTDPRRLLIFILVLEIIALVLTFGVLMLEWWDVKK